MKVQRDWTHDEDTTEIFSDVVAALGDSSEFPHALHGNLEMEGELYVRLNGRTFELTLTEVM